MIGIDTSIVIRIVVNDDVDQAQRARAVIVTQDVYVPVSVWLEAEWVLRSICSYPKQDVLNALKSFLLLPRVIAEDQAGVLNALNWAAEGVDFADALHLTSVRECKSFASFDQKLARGAARTNLMKVWEL